MYERISSRHSVHSRKSITGKYIGSSHCTGYCRFEGHSGFLTEKLEMQHHCHEKDCIYYVGKSSRIRIRKDGVITDNNVSEITKRMMSLA